MIAQELYDDLFSQIAESGSRLMEAIRTTSKEQMRVDNRLLIVGMGGSGISGDYITTLTSEHPTKRISVTKNYQIPSYVDQEWNAVVVSYSGNTEETISCLTQLLSKKVDLVCISSGGKLLEFSKDNGLQFISIPQGIQPRAAFPLLFGSIYGLIADSFNLDLPSLEAENRIIESSKLENKEQLRQISKELLPRFPIIVHPKQTSCVGTRFRCQLNENAKVPGANYVAPEFSHNAIVGFDGTRGESQALVLLRSMYEHRRTKIHLDFLRDKMSQAGYVVEFRASAANHLEELLNLTWQLDFVSVVLAELQGVDPQAVPSIDRLKSILKEM